MKGIRENLLLLWTVLLLGACAPAFPTGQPTDFIGDSDPSLGAIGNEAKPTDGTVGSQTESEDLYCEVLEQFGFDGEPQTNWTAPVLRTLPIFKSWDDFGSLYWRDFEDAETVLPPCSQCIGSVLRIISLGKFADEALNHEGEARLWFNKLLSHESLDAVYGPEIVYQDFEITDPVRFSLQNFPFESQGHYLFLMVMDDPDSFAGRGEKSTELGNFNSKEEFAANLGLNLCSAKGRIRTMRLVPSRLIFPIIH